MAKYTPGPWEIRHRLNVAKGNRGIANCGGYSDNNNQEQAQDENEANAQLIAAAPDLLAACKLAIEYLTTIAHDPNHSVLQQLRVAVIVAESEADNG